MRILLTARPLTGHVEPLRPLAEAAVRRGHEVAFATGEPVVSQLRDRGLQAFAAGRGYETRAEFDPRAREISRHSTRKSAGSCSSPSCSSASSSSRGSTTWSA